MMIKVFKTLLIFCLCFDQVFTINAAISVSDGSAFVTKAEFAADLNNLSSRMASLENNLDSKIDSLVSTYLSKNGIWNASKVDIDRTKSKLNKSNFITSWTTNDNLTKEVWSKSALVQKTGMCIATVHLQGYKDGVSGYRCYLRYSGGYWAGFEDDSRVMIWLNEIQNGIVYEKNVQQLACSYQRTVDASPADIGTCIVPLPTNNDYVLIAFVTKGNNIKVGITQYVSDFSSGTSNIDANAGLVGTSYLQVHIESCNIY